LKNYFAIFVIVISIVIFVKEFAALWLRKVNFYIVY
jgi:hypothetical protein